MRSFPERVAFTHIIWNYLIASVLCRENKQKPVILGAQQNITNRLRCAWSQYVLYVTDHTISDNGRF